MKKKTILFVLALLIALPLSVPAMAAKEHGAIYDETELLESGTLTVQGEQTLPQLTDTLGLDLRVDVLTQTSYDSMSDTAAGIYARYDYGYGEDKEGATLTLLLEPQEGGGYAMPASDGWCVYANLSEGRGSSQELAAAIHDAVQPYMTEGAWNGEDMTLSSMALAKAVDAMAEAAEAYILKNCPPEAYSEPVHREETAAQGQDSVEMKYIFDVSDLLGYEEWRELESRAGAYSQNHHCGIYFALVDDYTDYGDGSVYQVTYEIYHQMQLGMGDNRDGIIVLLSMEERHYAMFVYGDYAEYAFNEFGQEKLEEKFLGDFGHDDWYGGIANYLDACDEFLTMAEAGEPVRPPYELYFFAIAVLACLAAGIVCHWLVCNMKGVRQKAEANAYIAKDGLHLEIQRDQFIRTSVTRSRIEKESSGSGSSRRESGGGGSGRSGRF